MQTLQSSGRGRMPRFVMALAAVTVLAGGCDSLFETDVNNPNAVIESALGDPAGATTLVNGSGAAVTRALTSIYGPYHTATDELTWVGSREFWKNLDDGDVSDPVNEYTDGAYPFVSEARWAAGYALARVTSFDSAGVLRNRADLARANIFAAVIYTTIGEMFDDFVISSDRTVAGAPVGPANMQVMFDSAITMLNRAETVASAIGNAELRRQAVGLRARARFSRAAWGKVRPARAAPADPFVNDAGATADATLALSLMTATYVYRLTPTANNLAGINVGFEMNNRGELRAGDQFVNANPTRPIVPADGIAGIRMVDPVTGNPSPVVAAAIDACCRPAVGNNVPMTQVSAREMMLILAEARLAAADTAGFVSFINQARTTFALPDYAVAGATLAPRAQLEFERKTMLFLQGRRLLDLYRFGSTDPRWLTGMGVNGLCFLPITYGERLANGQAPQPNNQRSCS